MMITRSPENSAARMEGYNDVIYFIQCSGTCAIKIGHVSLDEADSRRRELQCGNPSELVLLGTMPGDLGTERQLHERFAAARIRGEWFRPVPDLLLLIWRGQAPPSAPDASSNRPRARPRGRPATALEEAKHFLALALAAGPVRTADMQRRAQERGISRNTLDRARADLSVVPFREGMTYFVRLPDPVPAPEAPFDAQEGLPCRSPVTS